jgi:uncharacterized sulfatase
MFGQPFLGADPPQARQYVYGARDRIDERYDMVRMVRDQQYRYVRNYMPWYTWLRKINYAERNAIRQEMRRLLAEGTLQPEAAQWLAATRPAEELYFLPDDPYEVKSLVNDPEHAAALARLRAECDRWTVETPDAHLLAEPFLQDADDQQGNRRSTVAGRQGQARAKQLMIAAKAASDDPDPAELRKLLGDDDPAVRWWATMGLGFADDPTALADAAKQLEDESSAVRIAAAWALNRHGKKDGLLPVLVAGLKDPNIWTQLWAIQTLDEMGDEAQAALAEIRDANKKSPNNYVKRIAETVLAKF